jgi:hypothetical protein
LKYGSNSFSAKPKLAGSARNIKDNEKAITSTPNTSRYRIFLELLKLDKLCSGFKQIL